MLNPPTSPLGPLDGGRRRTTNATTWRRGTRATSPLVGPPPSPWAYRSGVERFTAEAVAGAAALGALWAWVHEPELVARLGLWAAALGLAVVGWRAAGAAITWRHRRDVVGPLARGVAQLVGRAELERPRTFVDVPADYLEPGCTRPVKVRVHDAFASGHELVEDVMSAKLGAGELSFSWHLGGRNPHVAARIAHHPPDVVRWDELALRELVAAAPATAPVIGLAAGGRAVSVDLAAEAPHVLAGMSTGAGKSSFLRCITAQALHNGATAVICDLKRVSHPWARPVPAAHVHRDVESIHRALVEVGAEAERRYAQLDAAEAAGEPEPEFRPLVLVVEESNALVARLKRWWERSRDLKSGDPRESPAVDALRDVLFMGRQARIHVLMVAQAATASALGGSEVREQFAAKVLARFSQQAARYLIPEITPTPRSTRHPGRAIVVVGSVATAVQLAYVTDDEATAWATSGELAVTEPWTLQRALPPGESAVTVTSGAPSVTPGGRHLVAVPDLPEPERFTLAEAARRQLVPMRAAALRQAKRRDPEFPPGALVGKRRRFTADELRRWHADRPYRAPAAEAEL